MIQRRRKSESFMSLRPPRAQRPNLGFVYAGQHCPSSQKTSTKMIIVEISPPPNFHAAAPASRPLNKLFISSPCSFFMNDFRSDAEYVKQAPFRAFVLLQEIYLTSKCLRASQVNCCRKEATSVGISRPVMSSINRSSVSSPANSMTASQGFIINRASFYVGKLGRFISEDTIGFGCRDINLYGIGASSPYTRDSSRSASISQSRLADAVLRTYL